MLYSITKWLGLELVLAPNIFRVFLILFRCLGLIWNVVWMSCNDIIFSMRVTSGKFLRIRLNYLLRNGFLLSNPAMPFAGIDMIMWNGWLWLWLNWLSTWQYNNQERHDFVNPPWFQRTNVGEKATTKHSWEQNKRNVTGEERRYFF